MLPKRDLEESEPGTEKLLDWWRDKNHGRCLATISVSGRLEGRFQIEGLDSSRTEYQTETYVIVDVDGRYLPNTFKKAWLKDPRSVRLTGVLDRWSDEGHHDITMPVTQDLQLTLTDGGHWRAEGPYSPNRAQVSVYFKGEQMRCLSGKRGEDGVEDGAETDNSIVRMEVRTIPTTGSRS